MIPPPPADELLIAERQHEITPLQPFLHALRAVRKGQCAVGAELAIKRADHALGRAAEIDAHVYRHNGKPARIGQEVNPRG